MILFPRVKTEHPLDGFAYRRNVLVDVVDWLAILWAVLVYCDFWIGSEEIIVYRSHYVLVVISTRIVMWTPVVFGRPVVVQTVQRVD